MYFKSNVNHPSQLTGLRGLGQPRDTSDTQRSLDAIRKALDLNPIGGYVKGSAARRQLEDALRSVPITSALETFNRLKNGEGPLGRLFQHRLHDATKPVVLNILQLKHLEQQRKLKEAEDELKRVCAEEKRAIDAQRAAVKVLEDSVARLCEIKGEDSDDCQKRRFGVLESKARLEDRIRKHTSRCP